VAEQLAVGVHRAADEAAAVQAQQHPVVAGGVGNRPHGRHSTGVYLQVVHATGLAGDVAPVLVQVAALLQRRRGTWAALALLFR